jgi:hypothetical protein
MHLSQMNKNHKVLDLEHKLDLPFKTRKPK